MVWERNKSEWGHYKGFVVRWPARVQNRFHKQNKCRRMCISILWLINPTAPFLFPSFPFNTTNGFLKSTAFHSNYFIKYFFYFPPLTHSPILVLVCVSQVYLLVATSHNSSSPETFGHAPVRFCASHSSTFLFSHPQNSLSLSLSFHLNSFHFLFISLFSKKQCHN